MSKYRHFNLIIFFAVLHFLFQMNVNRGMLSVNFWQFYIKTHCVNRIVSFCDNVCVSQCECNVVISLVKLQSHKLVQVSVYLGYCITLELRLHSLNTA